jgi:hypothetical protein
MALESRVEIHSSYLQLYCKGEFEYDSMKKSFDKAFDEASEKVLAKILFDGIKITGTPPTTLERFNLGEYAAELCWQFGKPIRIALAAKIPIVDPKRFGETVARNRGANGKVFTDLEEAKDWLML